MIKHLSSSECPTGLRCADNPVAAGVRSTEDLHASKVVPLARSLAGWLLGDSEIAVLQRLEWGVWPSSESEELLRGWATLNSLGVDVDGALAVSFDAAGSEAAAAFLAIALLGGWGIVGESADSRRRFELDHDGGLRLFGSDPAGAQAVAAVVAA